LYPFVTAGIFNLRTPSDSGILNFSSETIPNYEKVNDKFHYITCHEDTDRVHRYSSTISLNSALELVS
jgi:hypothetical protein